MIREQYKTLNQAATDTLGEKPMQIVRDRHHDASSATFSG